MLIKSERAIGKQIKKIALCEKSDEMLPEVCVSFVAASTYEYFLPPHQDECSQQLESYLCSDKWQ